MDKYQRIKKIGEGSFGKALLVRHKENGKQFVIKEINISKMGRKEREDSRKEVAVLAQMNHPNIVFYRESFEEAGNLHIVMDFCEGGDLYGRMNKQRGVLFPEDTILDWFVQICLSIKHIHDRKILHRDIKTQNIFLTKHGVVKLGDFGIAKVLNSTVELARTCIGTPYYLSPEICENRPYNNKSDIWSLGCVLYELATLKHAFEAGNMKNLVLKIIRGSFPPVPPRYSYELRNLIAALLKRNPRDRPSVNSILKKNFIQARIKKFLNESEVQDEFSHTVMHGQKIKKALPPGGIGLAPARAVPKAKPSAAAPPKYNPASVYGVPVARRSRENRKSDERKKPAAHPGPLAYQQDLARKRAELIAKENVRRGGNVVAKKQDAIQQHKDLVEKQKVARLNKAREEGWKQLISSLDSDEGIHGNNDKKAPAPAAAPVFKPAEHPAQPFRERAPKEAWDEARGADRHAQQANEMRVKAGQAADRAKQVEEFMQRKRQAALNKQRGGADIYGNPYNKPPSGARAAEPVVSKRPWSAVDEGRNQQEQEYLARLRQIRLQNFNERRANRDKGAADHINMKVDHEARKKKIEALKKQADDRAKKLKEELERKRRDAYEKEKQKWNRDGGGRAVLEGQAAGANKPPVGARPVSAQPLRAVGGGRAVSDRPVSANRAVGQEQAIPAHRLPKPAPVIGMTNVMKAIGADMPAFDAGPSDEELLEQVGKSPLQKKKDEILKKVNANHNADRPKWGQPVQPIVPAMERPKWAGEGTNILGGMALEETSSAMEATNAGDIVEKHMDQGRKQWGAKRAPGTVLNALQKAQVSVGATMTIQPKDEQDGTPAEGLKPGTPIGETVTLAKTPVKKDTIVISSPEKEGKPVIADKPRPKTAEPNTTPNKDSNEASVRPKTAGSSPRNTEVKKSALFEKVQLDEDDEDDEKIKKVQDADDIQVEDLEDEETPDNKFQMASAGVMIGLTTGHFDIPDSRMLRTCSLPDLSKLFRTAAENPFLGADQVSFSLNVDAELDEDEYDEELGSGDHERESVEDDDNEANSEENEDDDQEENDEEHQDQEDGSEDDSNDENDDEDEDMQSMREAMGSLLNDDDKKTPAKPKTPKTKKTKLPNSGKGDSIDGAIGTIIPGKEDWDSDDTDEGQGDIDDEDDRFCRLEESRIELENALGENTFIKAYKTVQAIHEDEDESLEECGKLVTKILGDGKEQYYTKILQLVMADGAYTEDND
ncbi:unnamed protein product [Owenia fusiformis]|uniref:non-specific serine/threonine protein kinase n=1 Tax=Owenia fusiformis TaxID=6347 RepID=A0A8J1TIS7_OWEFU|nr:unnamed protein product [Owenia fusiformis]